MKHPVLRNSQFLKLWGNEIFLQVGLNLCNYTALLLIAYSTHSLINQAWFYVAITIPAVLFGFIAGPTVEIVNRKTLLMICVILLSILFGVYSLSGNSFVVLIIIGFLSALVARFFVPAVAATLPLILGKEELEEGNSLFLLTLLGSVIVGYVLATPIIQYFGGIEQGGHAPFVIAAILLLVGLVVLFSLKPLHQKKPQLEDATLLTKTGELIMQVITEISHNYYLSASIGLLAFVELNIGMLTVVLLEYVRRYLHLPLISINSILIFPFIIGVIIGAFLLKGIGKRYGYRNSVIGACFLVGIVFITFGIAPLFLISTREVAVLRVLASSASFLVGIAIVIIAVLSRTVLQINAPLTMQGRIFSVVDIVIALVTPVPVLIFGFFATAVDLLTALTIYGYIVVFAIAGASMLIKARDPKRVLPK